MKFRRGETVRCRDSGYRVTAGKCYVVRGFWSDGIKVNDDEGTMGSYFGTRFERVNEMAEKEKIEAQIKQNQTDQKKLCEEGERLCKELKGLEVTYHIGDRFEYNGCKYILVRGNGCTAGLINLSNGNQWADNREVQSRYKITQAEFEQIDGRNAGFVRYWDSGKEDYDN